jgi:CheY-like chemotaxis protein
MSEPITILIYHPNKILLNRLIQFTQAAGYRAFGCSDDSEAVRLVSGLKPEVFLAAPLVKTDLAVAEEVQRTYPWTRVIVLADTDTMAEHARNMGIDEVVVYDGTDIGNVLESIRSSFPDCEAGRFSGSAGVLVVDDQPDAVDMLGEFLSHSGHRALGANTGGEALEILKRDADIRIVLLDINLPDMGGMQVLTEIMNLRRPVAVIMLTALRDSVIAQHALRLGAFDYVAKPVDLPALAETIAVCLSRIEYRERHWWSRRHASDRPA